MVSGLFQRTMSRVFPGCTRMIKAVGRGFAMAGLAMSVAVTALAVPQAAVARPSVTVEVNHSTRLALRGAAASVIVGNPAIADVTVIDARTVYVMGRGLGSTTISVLDANGRAVWEGLVAVSPARSAGVVSVYRGRTRTDMQCGGGCTPMTPTGPNASGSSNSGTLPPPMPQAPTMP